MPIIKTFIVPHPPLIVPKIGGGQEMKIQKTIDAYEKIAKLIAEIKPDTIVLTTPHSIMYSDYIHISPGRGAKGNFREFGQEQVSIEVEYDTDFIKKLSTLAEENNIPAGTWGEKNKSLDHGTMVPLYFVNKYYNDYKLVRISISGLSYIEHYRFGKCIGEAADESDKKIVFIASGDLSHMLKEEGPYGYKEEGVIFDREITAAMKKGDFLEFLKFDEEFCESAAECGLRSFIIMAGALDGKSVESELLSYEGPFGVGYAVSEYTLIANDKTRHFDETYKTNEQNRIDALKNEEDSYVRLARQSLESYVIKHKRIKKTQELDADLLKKRSGVFVSLKMDGQLRGCIGTITPTTDCIADEIIQNAISAGAEDPRFYPVTEEELPRIVYSVDVLGEAEPINSMDELNPVRYGVIVEKAAGEDYCFQTLKA
ncbi:MAG: AmmeMemoRadiSam system protein A [Sedimentibacter sp.]|nr:AmmeMemoRadiSam system protein A [Sedimentibacter sp.]MDW5299184.1 AmmeMemoRadiSam system protein A [Sedimentibacter sp.]